jgi:hypothetical protein
VSVGIGVLVEVGVSVGVSVGVVVGVAVAVGVELGVGVHVGGRAAMPGAKVAVGKGGLNGLSATRGLMYTNKYAITTRMMRTTTTRVAI